MSVLILRISSQRKEVRAPNPKRELSTLPIETVSAFDPTVH